MHELGVSTKELTTNVISTHELAPDAQTEIVNSTHELSPVPSDSATKVTLAPSEAAASHELTPSEVAVKHDKLLSAPASADSILAPTTAETIDTSEETNVTEDKFQPVEIQIKDSSDLVATAGHSQLLKDSQPAVQPEDLPLGTDDEEDEFHEAKSDELSESPRAETEIQLLESSKPETEMLSGLDKE